MVARSHRTRPVVARQAAVRRACRGASDLPGMKAAVRQATRMSRPLDWREAGAYGDGLMSLVDMLRQRLSGPHAAQVPVAAEGGTRNARYDEAFEIVRAIGMLRARLDERAAFTRELEEIRAAYRAKRNFIKLLAKLS